jgi:uncharacterized protein YuzE
MILSYDKDADVLYVTFERPPESSYVYVENECGDVLRLDKTTKKVIGCTIPYFSLRTKDNKIEIPEVGSIAFNEAAENLVS